MATSEERRFLVDILLPIDSEDPEQAVQITSTGDLRNVTGIPNLVDAIRRRGLASPGEMVHRPDYGFGLVTQLERLMTPAQGSAIQNAGRRNLLRDPRIESAAVAVSSPDDSSLTCRIDVRPLNDDERVATTITVE